MNIAGISVAAKSLELSLEEAAFLLEDSEIAVLAELVPIAQTNHPQARNSVLPRTTVDLRVSVEAVRERIARDPLALAFLVWILERRFAPRRPSAPDAKTESLIEALERVG
jgi:hypothetical protein